MTKHEYYLRITETVGMKSTCLRRKYGAIIVKNDQIISTGYNGSPRGCVNCDGLGYCLRNIVGAQKGDSYNLCTSVHAEQNCIIAAPRAEMIGATLYIVGVNVSMEYGNTYASPNPCQICHRMIINSGIEKAYGFIGDIKSPDIAEIDISTEKFDKDINATILRLINETKDDKNIKNIAALL